MLELTTCSWLQSEYFCLILGALLMGNSGFEEQPKPTVHHFESICEMRVPFNPQRDGRAGGRVAVHRVEASAEEITDCQHTTKEVS